MAHQRGTGRRGSVTATAQSDSEVGDSEPSPSPAFAVLLCCGGGGGGGGGGSCGRCTARGGPWLGPWLRGCNQGAVPGHSRAPRAPRPKPSAVSGVPPKRPKQARPASAPGRRLGRGPGRLRPGRSRPGPARTGCRRPPEAQPPEAVDCIRSYPSLSLSVRVCPSLSGSTGPTRTGRCFRFEGAHDPAAAGAAAHCRPSVVASKAPSPSRRARPPPLRRRGRGGQCDAAFAAAMPLLQRQRRCCSGDAAFAPPKRQPRRGVSRGGA